MNYQPVKLVQDDSSHWYCIPLELQDEFYKLSEETTEFESYWDKREEWKGTPNVQTVFDEKFGGFRTGGGPNVIGLAIAIELNKPIEKWYGEVRIDKDNLK